MNDIRPPRRPEPRPIIEQPFVAPVPAISELPKDLDLQLPPTPKRPTRRKKILLAVMVFFAIIALIAIALVVWYFSSLRPVDTHDTKHSRVVIAIGSSPKNIGDLLQEKQLIRSSSAFDLYTRLSGSRAQLQAGAYSIAPADSTQQIVDKLVKGEVDDTEIDLTFFPGAMLVDNSDQPDKKKVDVRSVLRRAGYKDEEINAAFAKQYDSPLFAGLPAGKDIEGYVYGDTYRFNPDATVEQILERTFDEFYTVVQENDLVDGFKKQGLTLYQGITLASIIQREVSGLQDQKQVAQVFYTRLAMNMPLGSDVTYHYAADKLGIARDYRLDSPYNTRIVTGLPPGPIAVPGLTALQAAVAPAAGDYVYFLSGDDNNTYFARTNQEHEANIQNHCKQKCLLP